MGVIFVHVYILSMSSALLSYYYKNVFTLYLKIYFLSYLTITELKSILFIEEVIWKKYFNKIYVCI